MRKVVLGQFAVVPKGYLDFRDIKMFRKLHFLIEKIGYVCVWCSKLELCNVIK